MPQMNDSSSSISAAVERLAAALDALARALTPEGKKRAGWWARLFAFCERIALPLAVGAVGGCFTYFYNDREARQGEAEVARALITDLTSPDPARVLSAFAALEHLKQRELATAMCRAVSTARALQAGSIEEGEPLPTGGGAAQASARTMVELLGCRESVLERWEGLRASDDPQETAVLKQEVSEVALANISAATDLAAEQATGSNSQPMVSPVPPVAVDLVAGAVEQPRSDESRWGVVLGSDRSADAAFRTVLRVQAALKEISAGADVTLETSAESDPAGVFRKGRWYTTVVTGLATREDARKLGLEANRHLRQGYMLVDLSTWCPGQPTDAENVRPCGEAE